MKRLLGRLVPPLAVLGRARRVISLLTAVLLAAVHVPALAAEDSKGTEFWLMFTANLGVPELSLFITGDTNTSGVVSVPGLGFSAPFTVTPGTVTTIAVPAAAQVTALDTVSNQGVRVVANDEVTVYGLNRIQATTDAYLGLPTDILGNNYINLGYGNSNVVNATQFGIVGTQAGTVVTITPSAAAGVHPAGVPYNIVLNDGQTYQLRSTGPAADLSGTLISSTAPVAVFGSHQCANIPGAVQFCDHIVEQLPPTTTWGKAFVTMPLATRILGDTFRVLASTNNTGVSINGVVVATLNRGQVHEQIITGPARITTSEPVLVAQYSNGTSFDLVTSDPFQMLVPPFEQFLASYTVTTPASGFDFNFINLVVPNAAVGSVTLDGVSIPSAAYVPIPGSTFSGTQLSVALGSHNLAGPLPFGTFVYGFAAADSYGYPGGMALSQVAVVSSLTLAPKTASNPVNTQHCVNATLKDQNNAPVSGVRVDFTVTGVNANAGFANADVAGVAQFCYTGTAAGNDSIVASVGTLSDTASKTWTAVVRACDLDSDSDIDSNDIRAITRLRGRAVPPAPAAADYDNNKYININDARGCTRICTRPNCATS